MAKRNIANTAADPTLPKTPVTVGGKTYDLCFTFGALARAERFINAELERAGSNERVNLLAALPVINMGNLPLLFAAGVHQFHPELTFTEAHDLVDYADVSAVSAAIVAAFDATRVKQEKSDDPPQPGA